MTLWDRYYPRVCWAICVLWFAVAFLHLADGSPFIAAFFAAGAVTYGVIGLARWVDR